MKRRIDLSVIKSPGYRKNFLSALGGKALGVAAVFGIMGSCTGLFHSLLGSVAHAAPLTGKEPYISPINTAWTLIAAFLVFFMQAGFMCLEAGFGRERECINIVLEGIVDTCLCGILFWAFGFAFMFGAGNGFIGHQYFFLNNTPATYLTTGVPMLAIFLFQFAFADTCSTITSGAMLGRTGFVGDLLYSVGVSGFIYPIVGHWAWGPDGWLTAIPFFKMGGAPGVFHDFAGSTVVHTIGGFIALAGAICLGPRLGRVFKRDGGGLPPGHDMVLASVGGVILWFGWYGFNPGSTLCAMDAQGIARVACNTTLAACAGGLMAMAYAYPRSKTWDCGLTVNGFLAGLVAITCPCYWVSPFGAIVLGGIAGVIVVMGVDFIEWLRVDDPVGAVAVHGICGIWGTLSLGLFACGHYGSPGPTGADNSSPVVGLFYHGGFDQLIAQIIGSFTITVTTFVVAMALMLAVKATGTLRISKEGEEAGIDEHEHGTSAYPEFTIHRLMNQSHSYLDSGPVGAATVSKKDTARV